MRTLYIDIYFLINFTVDILALYFAAIFSKVPTTSARLILSSVIGALSAVAIVLIPETGIYKLIPATISLVIMGYITPKHVLRRRRIKFVFAFLIFEALVGGGVSIIWDVFDRYLSSLFASAVGGAVNRKMLVLSLIILISIGVFKMLVSFFSNNQGERSVELEISFLNHTTILSAFVDSGNLAIDPMDMSPLLLVKKDAAKSFLPGNIIDLCDIDSLDYNVKKKIRLIPVTRGGVTHVIVGVKADSVKLIDKDKSEEIKVTVAIDREGGDFGGFEALMPSAALDNVF